MSGTWSSGLSHLTYQEATVIPSCTSNTQSVEASPNQRVVTALNDKESVTLRFTPRTVQQSEADTKTN
jgi:hypothetical protein